MRVGPLSSCTRQEQAKIYLIVWPHRINPTRFCLKREASVYRPIRILRARIDLCRNERTLDKTSETHGMREVSDVLGTGHDFVVQSALC